MSAAIQERFGNKRYREALTPRVFDAQDTLPLIALIRRIFGDDLTLIIIKYYNEMDSSHETNINTNKRPTDRTVSYRAHSKAVEELGLHQPLVDFFRTNFNTVPTEEQALATFIGSQVKIANSIVEEIRKHVFPDFPDQYSLKNGIQVPENTLLYPAQIMLGNGFVDPRLKFEIRRQQLILLLIMQLDDEHTQSNLNNNLHIINGLLEDYLYEGKYGETNPVTIFSLHNNISNECIQTQTTPPTQTPEGNHWKVNKLEARQIPGVGPVMSHYREKSKTSSVLKAIYNALNRKNGRQISAESVKDISGYFFVAETPEKQAQLCDLVISLLCQYLPDCEVVIDDEVGSGRTQSDEVDWLRRKVYFGNNREYPIEISFFHAVGYYNYRYKVGNITDDGELDSSKPLAHELFMERRARVVGELLFPEEFYPRPDGYETARIERRQEAINKLRNKNRYIIQ